MKLLTLVAVPNERAYFDQLCFGVPRENMNQQEISEQCIDTLYSVRTAIFFSLYIQ